MVARTADLMGVDHIGIGTDLCQQQPLQVLEWMRNGRWSKAKDYGEDRPPTRTGRRPAVVPRQPGLSVIAAGLRERASSMMNCAGSWG